LNLRPLGYEDREVPFNPVWHSLDAGGTIHLCRLRARREASTIDAN
jgi:hypothetical protein